MFITCFFRQLYRMVDWLYCEPMLIYYLRLFRESYWPENAPRQELITRPKHEQIRTRFLAKTKIVENMPGMLIAIEHQVRIMYF